MLIEKELTPGIFCCELKNRFRCEVAVKDKKHICYVASSCRLSNFIRLDGKPVLLLPAGENSDSTDYTLFAVKHRNSYILLNLQMVNAALEEQLSRRCFSFLGDRKTLHRERAVEGYKSDLFIEDTGTIVEIKTVISTEKEAIFPSVFSERSLQQLTRLKALLEAGYCCCILFACLSPSVQVIKLDHVSEFGRLFKECVERGLKYKAFRIKTTERSITVDRPVMLIF